MSSEPLDYRHPATRDGGQSVRVERRADGSVAVGIHYPHKQRIETHIGVAISGATAVGVPILLRVAGAPWLAAVGIGAVVGVPVCFLLLELFRSASFPQEWLASREGLTITRLEREGRTRRRFISRSKISDVRIKFYRSGCDIWVRGRFAAIGAPQPTLHGLGGDQIARVADALREGLGMVPVDWPSGRPRRVAARAVRTTVPAAAAPVAAAATAAERTASTRGERLLQLALGVFFMGMGLLFAVNGGLDARRAYHRLHEMHQTTCVLLDKRVDEGTGEHTWGRHASTPYQAWTRIRYDDDAGGTHTVAGDLFPTNDTENGQPPKYVLWNMKVGSRYPLWIDDREPTRVYLSRGNDSPWGYSFMIGGGTIFTLVGMGCVIDLLVRRSRSTVRPARA